MEPLRFGLIGLGRFGKHYVRLIKNIPNVKLVGVASRTKKTISNLRHILPASTIKTTDSSILLKNKKIDCIIIATPCETHFDLAKKAIENGKHVLLEKPMVKNLKEASNLSKILRKSDSTFMVGHQYLFNDNINYLKSQLQKNAFGKIKLVFADHLYKAPKRNDIGCFWDAGTHQLAILHYLLNPGRIIKVTGKSIDFSKNGLDDFTAVTLKFQSNLIANFIVNWNSINKSRKYIIFGDKKTAVFDEMVNNKIRIFPGESVPFNPKIITNEPLKNELNHFLDCVKNKKIPRTDFKNSFEITAWLDKISKSIKLPGYV